jgi:outer membrane translocation and assembly module TamA
MMTEYKLKAVKAVYLALSGGAANVWNARDDMSLRDLRKGASIGLHADTLIGPVRLDFGAGEDRRYLVYFSALRDLIFSDGPWNAADRVAGGIE